MYKFLSWNVQGGKNLDDIAKVIAKCDPKTKKQRILDMIQKGRGYKPKHFKSGLELQKTVRS